jgi:hypothetical protein
VSGNDPCDFAIYVLLLVAINLFLRKLEFSSLQESNFNLDMFVMTGEYIVGAMHLKVLGKAVRNTTRGEFHISSFDWSPPTLFVRAYIPSNHVVVGRSTHPPPPPSTVVLFMQV